MYNGCYDIIQKNEKLLDDFHTARNSGNELAAGVLAQMLDRDLSKFNPTGVAPETPYLHEMRKMADRPIADYISEQFKQGVDNKIVDYIEKLPHNVYSICCAQYNESKTKSDIDRLKQPAAQSGVDSRERKT